jgi:hypothetical protein
MSFIDHLTHFLFKPTQTQVYRLVDNRKFVFDCEIDQINKTSHTIFILVSLTKTRHEEN